MNQSNSYDNLLKNLEELDALVAFYQKIKDEPVATQVGRHHNPYILLKSGIIFIDHLLGRVYKKSRFRKLYFYARSFIKYCSISRTCQENHR